MAPAAQDLSILGEKGLIDPVREPGPWGELSDLALELRARREPGVFLLEVEPIQPETDWTVEIQVAGKTVERVGLARNYREIPVAGRNGDTVFRLVDGAISVVRSSCRHKLCEKMGPVHTGRVVCAPNRLVALMRGAPSAVDSITG
jgi:hypothetical protein